MKITPNTKLSPILPQSSKSGNQIAAPPPPPAIPSPDLRRKKYSHRKPPRRRNPAVRTPTLHLKKDAAGPTSAKRGGPPTPLLRWKFDEVDGERDLVHAGADKGGGGALSVRKLAAALWRLQAPEAGTTQQYPRRSRKDRLGFQQNTSHVDVGKRLSSNHGDRGFCSEAKGQPMSPCSVNGPTNGYTYVPQAPAKYSNLAMEGATKWDPVFPEKNEESSSFHFCNQNQNTASKVSSLQSELEQAQKRIEELELEQRSSKKKLKQFLLKLSEERSAWRSREHEKVRAIISDVKAELMRERKNCQRQEVINSKLVKEVDSVKSAMKRYMHEFEKERKNRELVEEVCDELANEIGEDKAEVEALKTECLKIREEVDDERKMLQMAEVWREERVQMKLIDAKVTLEDKYSQMNSLIADLKLFIGSRNGSLDSSEIKEAEVLQQAAASVKIQDMKEFTYEPPKSDDIFSIFEEMGLGNDDLDDEQSGWETVSQADDQGSSFTPEGSVMSFKRMAQRGSHVSESGTEWEGNRGGETPGSEISGVSSSVSKSSKKMSAISRLWRSGHSNGESYTMDGVKGRLSNGSMEWPRGQKKSLKAKLLEARVESQKVQLKQVLRQKT